MKLVLFFATLAEAAPTLRYLQARYENGVFRFSKGIVICTGMGIQNAHFAAKRAPKKQVFWVNLGVAGSFSSKKQLYTTVEIDGIFPLQQKADSMEKAIVLRKDVKNLLFTSHVPIYQTLSVPYKHGFVDMEAYPIAREAVSCGIFFTSIKVVSDICSPNSSSEIAKNLPICANILQRIVEEQFIQSLENHSLPVLVDKRMDCLC